MKHFTLLAGFCFAFVCCLAQTKKELYIPDRIQMVKQSGHELLPGTRVFVVRPKGYQLAEKLIRCQKNDNTYFQVLEIQSINFEVRKPAIMKEYDDAIRSGKLPPMYYRREFKFGNYAAMIFYAGDPMSNIEQIVLAFGNKDFGVIATGQMLANDKISRDEILKALLSLYVDEGKKSDPTVLANYTLDVSNTSFAYAGNASPVYFYTVGGKSDLSDPYQNQILVQTLPAMKDAAALKAHSLRMLDHYKTSKIKILNYHGRDITINGKYAHEITFVGTFEGKAVTTYQIVTGNDKTSVVLAGNVFGKHPELITQIKKIARSLKVK